MNTQKINLHDTFNLATKQDLADVRLEIKEAKTDMIKWFFAFFITLVLMILGLYATVLLK